MDKNLTPIASHCLIKKTESALETTKAGIILTKRDENFEEGVLLAIGNKLDSDKDMFDKDLEVGANVLFDRRLVIYETDDNCFLVPFNSIVGLLNKRKSISASNVFFDLPSYDDLMGKNQNLWKSYQNIKSISINSQFITPFLNIEPIFKLNHEMVFERLKDIQELDYKSIEADINEEKHVFTTHVSDDVWHGIYQFSSDQNGLNFNFVKNNTSVENIIKTLPQLLIPYCDTMRSNLFQKVSNQDFGKAKRLSIAINQEVKLMGAGTLETKIKNSEIMQQFLKLSSGSDSTEKSLLSALSFDPDDIKRIDLTISFIKIINGNMYNIFMTIQAPANDDNSILDITWNIQDFNPGIIPNRNLGEVFSEFFVKTVMQSFYHRWFKTNRDINVITLRK